MGSDYFAVLRQPRRPWLDLDGLKKEYQRLAFREHPDRKSRDAKVPPTLASVNEAYRVLSNPRLRLQHLLDLEGHGSAKAATSEVTSELAQVFMEAANLVSQIDAHLQKREQATTALGKSLLQAETAELQKRVALLLEQLQQSYKNAEKDLRRADETWSKDPAGAAGDLHRLGQGFAFLERWIAQLRERQFQLSS